jgi:hypothetical protein
MKRINIIIGIILFVLSGCQNENIIKPYVGGRIEYQYYDETFNLIKTSDKEDSKSKGNCSSYNVIQYDRDNRIIEADGYRNLNDYDPENDMHDHLVYSYKDNKLVSSKMYIYLYDGSLSQLVGNDYENDRIIKLTEYSVDGKEEVISYEVYEYNDLGEMTKSLFYNGAGILVSSQEWGTDENGNAVYTCTSYNPDGTVRDQTITVKE